MRCNIELFNPFFGVKSTPLAAEKVVQKRHLNSGQSVLKQVTLYQERTGGPSMKGVLVVKLAEYTIHFQKYPRNG